MSGDVKEIDARVVAPTQILVELLRAFDALDPEGSLVLVGERYPKAQLLELQRQRPGAFDWNVLRNGSSLCRVGIARRRTERPRGIAECLRTDHRRLDALALEAERRVAAGEFEAAAATFSEFTCGLNRHIDIEEFVLFPLFSRVTGMERGPIDVMRDEHRHIRRHLDNAARAVAGGDANAFVRSVRAMNAVLVEHNMKEEHVLYPATDDGLHSDDARAEAVMQMQAF